MKFSEAPCPPFYGAAHRLVKNYFNGRYRLVIEGQQYLPDKGAYILAPTHRSDKDPMLAGISVPDRAVRFMAKREMWTDIKRYKGLGQLVFLLGSFPVDRQKPDSRSLQRARRVLADGMVLGLFAEGTRRRGEQVGELEKGVAHFALQASCRVVPMGLASEKLGPGETIGVVIGPPLSADGRGATAKRELTEKLRAGLQTVFDRAQNIRETKP